MVNGTQKKKGIKLMLNVYSINCHHDLILGIAKSANYIFFHNIVRWWAGRDSELSFMRANMPVPISLTLDLTKSLEPI